MMIDHRLANGHPFKVWQSYLPPGKYRVRPESYKDDGSVLLQRWDEEANDWLSEGRRSQVEILRLLVRDNIPSLVIDNACAACNGTGYCQEPRLGDEPCPACNGTGKRTSISTLGRDVKADNPSGKKVGRPRGRVVAEADLDNAPDMATEAFREVLALLNHRPLTLAQTMDELGWTRRQTYHCVYWLRAAGYLSEEIEDGVRGRLYAITSKGEKYLSKLLKELKKV